MSKKLNLSPILGAPKDRNEILADIRKNPSLAYILQQFPQKHREAILDFLSGEKMLEILYDPFFKRIMDPTIYPERLESLLSALFHQSVSIKQVLPNEGQQLVDNGSFVIMDILVELEGGRLVDVEMQKLGYQFPAQRSSCYASDIIMRQYNRVRAQKGRDFTYRDIQDIHLFVIMEKSSEIFRNSPEYLHQRITSYSSGISLPETANITYISLDTFRGRTQNIDNELDAWLTFLSCNDTKSILNLMDRYPMFQPLYSDIAEFRKKPEELIYMFSEALYILDHNTERFMVDELQEENEQLTKEVDSLHGQVNSLNGQVDSLNGQVVSLNGQVDSLNQEKSDLQRIIDTYERTYGKLP